MLSLLVPSLGVGAAALLLISLGLVIMLMVRSSKPDPKLELLLSLMKDFPREEEEGRALDDVPAETKV